jgi:hypothetical protein
MKLQLTFLVVIVPSVEFHLLPLRQRKLGIACGYGIPNIFDKEQLFGQLQALNFISYFINFHVCTFSLSECQVVSVSRHNDKAQQNHGRGADGISVCSVLLDEAATRRKKVKFADVFIRLRQETTCGVRPRWSRIHRVAAKPAPELICNTTD